MLGSRRGREATAGIQTRPTHLAQARHDPARRRHEGTEHWGTYWLIRRTSTVLRSKSSKNGSAANPSYAGCWPASSYGRPWSVDRLAQDHSATETHHDSFPFVLDNVAR